MSCGSRGTVDVQSLCTTAFYHSGRAEVRWSQVTIVLIVLVCYSCPIVICGIRLQEPNPVVLLLGARLPIPVNSMTSDRKIVSHGVAMDKLWLKPSILKPYWLGHDLKLVHSKPPLVILWPEEIRQPLRGLSRVSLIVSLVLLDFPASRCLFEC